MRTFTWIMIKFWYAIVGVAFLTVIGILVLVFWMYHALTGKALVDVEMKW